MKTVKRGKHLTEKERRNQMEVLSMTDKQWKGWLRRFKRDLEEIKDEKDEKEREKKLNVMLEEIQQDLED